MGVAQAGLDLAGLPTEFAQQGGATGAFGGETARGSSAGLFGACVQPGGGALDSAYGGEEAAFRAVSPGLGGALPVAGDGVKFGLSARGERGRGEARPGDAGLATILAIAEGLLRHLRRPGLTKMEGKIVAHTYSV